MKPPELLKEADELRSQTRLVQAQAHGHAGIAFLFDLIVTDPANSALKHRLMEAFKSEPSAREEVEALAGIIETEALFFNLHPFLLATAMIWWGKEADLAENETGGSSDWQVLPIAIQNHRRELRDEFRFLAREIEDLFRGSGLEPDVSIKMLKAKCKALEKGLDTLQKSLDGHQLKRKKLFYANSKNEIRAYYLLRVKKLRTTSREVSDLLRHAGEHYDMSQRNDRLRAQKRVHDWARAFEKRLDALMLDAGYERVEHQYLAVGEARE
ncbi:MAG: hypothetical protein JST35_05330 [Armatimonadetes bacterium]|nr:hypothetical protein [Armatimonadota bacterium]